MDFDTGSDAKGNPTLNSLVIGGTTALALHFSLMNTKLPGGPTEKVQVQGFVHEPYEMKFRLQLSVFFFE